MHFLQHVLYIIFTTCMSFRDYIVSYPISHEAKEVSFKILNDIYPSTEFLHKRFHWKDTETVVHILFQCELEQVIFSELTSSTECGVCSNWSFYEVEKNRILC